MVRNVSYAWHFDAPKKTNSQVVHTSEVKKEKDNPVVLMVLQQKAGFIL